LPVKKGDFILLDFIATIKDSGEVFDTTIEERAKEAGIFREDQIYEPMLVVVGQHWLLDAVEEALVGMSEGETKVIEIPPERAFGPRDPNKVRLIPLRRLRRYGIEPEVGKTIEYEGQIGTILWVGSGRVQVDFNHHLAGKTLVYELTVRKIVEELSDKLFYLFKKWLAQPIEQSDVQIVIEEDSATLQLSPKVYNIPDLQRRKIGFVKDVLRLIPDLNEIRFLEVHKRPESRSKQV